MVGPLWLSAAVAFTLAAGTGCSCEDLSVCVTARGQIESERDSVAQILKEKVESYERQLKARDALMEALKTGAGADSETLVKVSRELEASRKETDTLKSQIQAEQVKSKADSERLTVELQNLKALYAEEAQKKQALEASLAAERATLSAEIANLKKEKDAGSESLQRRLMSLESESKAKEEKMAAELKETVARLEIAEAKAREVETKLAGVDEREAAHQSTIKEAMSKLKSTEEQLLASTAKLQKTEEQMSAQLKAFELKLKDSQEEVRKSQELINELKKRADLNTVIFSSAQFYKHLDDAKVIGRAFTGVLQKKWIKLIGHETHDLMCLQTRVWYDSLSEHVGQIEDKAVEYYTKIRLSVAGATEKVTKNLGAIYNDYLQSDAVDNFVSEKYGRMRQMMSKDSLYGMMESMMSGVVRVLDNRMNQTIENLSSVNPKIRDRFPKNFEDRCFSFSFILFYLYILLSVVSGAFNFIFSGKKNKKNNKQKNNKKTHTKVQDTKKVNAKPSRK